MNGVVDEYQRDSMRNHFHLIRNPVELEQSSMESIIQFPNERGEMLRGVLHTSESLNPAGTKQLVIFPNGGVMGSEGDYRAHVSMARHLAKGGYHVIRFSPAGLGYSEGQISDCGQKNLYNQIENGLMVADIRAAVNFAGTLDSFSSITLSGICGGAISSFLAAAEIDEVGYVIPIGIPVILDDDCYDYNKRFSALDKHVVIRTYLDKITSIKAWLRLFSGTSDVTKIKSAILAFFRGKGSYIGGENDKTKFLTNPLFSIAARKIFRKQKKVLFVFGDSDGFWWEFQKLFLKKHYDGVRERPFDLYISHRSNHMLNIPEMQLDVARTMLSWMDKHHGQA
jgi:alpha/beta superfamily hydrolase